METVETEFKKERNENYEKFQLPARKQHIGESMDFFPSVLNGLAVRCNFYTLKTRILRDVIIVNMINRDAQNELCRSTKRRRCIRYHYLEDKCANNSSRAPSTGATGGALQVKRESNGAIGGSYRTSKERA